MCESHDQRKRTLVIDRVAGKLGITTMSIDRVAQLIESNFNLNRKQKITTHIKDES